MKHQVQGLDESSKAWCYSLEPNNIIWTAGAVTTANFRSGPESPDPESPDLLRISRYSWQRAHWWQKQWVTKSSHGSPFIRHNKEVVTGKSHNKVIATTILSDHAMEYKNWRLRAT